MAQVLEIICNFCVIFTIPMPVDGQLYEVMVSPGKAGWGFGRGFE